MFFKNKKPALNSRRETVPLTDSGGGNSLIKEAWWLALVVIGIYLTVILATYHPHDSSWSHSASDSAAIQNAGGAAGAWVSDILLYLFGLSAWWMVVFAFYAMWLVYLRLEIVAASERPLLLFNIVGFFMLLIASSALEVGHIVSLPAHLPLNPGGMLGSVVDQLLQSMLGFTGSTMLLLLLLATGFSLFTGWSWILMAEKLGGAIINTSQFISDKLQDRQDRKLGKVAEQLRTEFVDSERKRVEDHAPSRLKCLCSKSPRVTVLKKSANRRFLKQCQIHHCRHCICSTSHMARLNCNLRKHWILPLA